MTLYFDYSTMMNWSGTPTGVPRTVYSLEKAFRKIYPDIKLVCISDELNIFHDVKYTQDSPEIGAVTEFAPNDVLLSVGANWAFACYNTNVKLLKNTGVHFYQLFYDIIPYLYPYFYAQGTGFGDYFGNWVLNTLSLCDGAFAISECTKSDVEKLASLSNIQHQELNVVRLGEDFDRFQENHSIPNRFLNLENYILVVGTLEIRKNQSFLLNVYRRLHQKYPKKLPTLILAGRQGWIDSNIQFQVENDRDLEGLVEVITDASDQELELLYKRCLFTLFPAIYEGWGLPVAESLKYGKQCISSNTSSMMEIAPHLIRSASPYSIEEWVGQIEELLFSPEKLTSENNRICNEFIPTKWTDTAKAILDQIIG